MPSDISMRSFFQPRPPCGMTSDLEHFNRIKPKQSLVEAVCLQLAPILRKQLTEGHGWLPPERELAVQLGVSRPVLREASKRLELQGLLEIRHGVGIRITDRLHLPLIGSFSLLIPDTEARLQQSLEVRAVVESSVASLAARNATPGNLRELHRAQANLRKSKDLADAVEKDVEFHRVLAKTSGNKIFELILEALVDLGRESRKITISYATIKRAIEHHEAVIKAVEARNAEGAFKAMQHHITAATKDLVDGLKALKEKHSE